MTCFIILCLICVLNIVLGLTTIYSKSFQDKVVHSIISINIESYIRNKAGKQTVILFAVILFLAIGILLC